MTSLRVKRLVPVALLVLAALAATGSSATARSVAGAFNGGGQSSAVNSLLSYDAPLNSSTDLPAGLTYFDMILWTDPKVDLSTFTIEVNGFDYTSMYRDRLVEEGPGMHFIRLDLGSGRNVVKVSAEGVFGSRRSTDTDRLVFKVLQ
ncbi:MAG TPA: hypothetical protein VNA89_06270 [Gemmatimonadaceae bacterium]|nr:hypothetical protein [Gemmatimonadaceae bacterium]